MKDKGTCRHNPKRRSQHDPQVTVFVRFVRTLRGQKVGMRGSEPYASHFRMTLMWLSVDCIN